MRFLPQEQCSHLAPKCAACLEVAVDVDAERLLGIEHTNAVVDVQILIKLIYAAAGWDEED